MFKLISPIAFLTIAILTVACQINDPENGTTINWENHPDRPWTGRKIWAVPLDDWSVTDGAATAGLTTGNWYATNEFKAGEQIKTLFLLDGKLIGGNFSTAVKFAFDTQQEDAFFAVEFGHKWEKADDRSVINRHKRPLGPLIKVTANGILEVGDTKENIEIDRGRFYKLSISANETEQGEVELNVKFFDEQNQQLAEVSALFPVEQIKGIASLDCWAGNAEPGGSFKIKSWNISGSSYQKTTDLTIGPVFWSMYSLNNDILKMNAQMFPIGKQDNKEVHLEIKRTEDEWERISTTTIDTISYTALFRLTGWDAAKDYDYRISYSLRNKDNKEHEFYYPGTIRKDPVDKEIITLANANCTKGQLFPYTKTVQNLIHQDPDIVLFSGDQLYEDTGEYRLVRALGGADHETIKKSYHNYLGRLAYWGWAFRDLMRNRPTIVLTDDHDVYQGNIWGEGGVTIYDNVPDHNKGGYSHHPIWINAVQRAQMAQNPDPFDPTPIGNDITVHYGGFTYGRVSFAMLEDRKFKSGPNGKVNTWPGRPDHVPADLKDFNPSSLDLPDLKLLGDRQLKFLDQWVQDWKGADMKCILSQTIFCNVATHHGGGQRLLADLDSNGWPQTGRNNALKTIRKAFAPHLAGDQHLPSLVQYGIDDWNEASFAFTAPAVATGYPRRWFVDDQISVNKRYELENTGEFKDGLGNKITVHGVGNPDKERGTPGLWDKNSYEEVEGAEAAFSSGYGLIAFNKKDLTYTFNAYRLKSDARNPSGEDQFPGFPKTISMEDNYAKKTDFHLPEIDLEGITGNVLIKVWDENESLIYARRINKQSFELPVFIPGRYKVYVGDPDEAKEKYVELNTGQVKESIKISF
ncbi:alkaline phosphatase D family protein [Fulvivirgaceae bacterium BMA10]|uniref:Alkaline phosphatase D family protein n=1 Tax=Splendidivirga corallicola TaxID=3051826 RepID=A0ABT8KPL4_9BACT|nr:alkaline phosphatase D family protein [Fulvivirgaceae bacterium BMA10]